MVLKIRRRTEKGDRFEYKTSKNILTPKDIEEADNFDLKLDKTIKEVESILLKRKILSRESKKKDSLRVWYVIGKHINKFLELNKIAKDEEGLFWNNLYGRSSLLHKGIPSSKVSLTRNDFRTASLLAQYPYEVIEKAGPWALWREILSYKVILNDRRILEWVIKKLTQEPRTRDDARPLLKSIATRFKRIETTILKDEELLKKLVGL